MAGELGRFRVRGRYGEVLPGPEQSLRLEIVDATNPPFSMDVSGVVEVVKPGTYLITAQVRVLRVDDGLLTVSVRMSDRYAMLELVAAQSVKPTQAEEELSLTGICQIRDRGELHLRAATTGTRRAFVASSETEVRIVRLA